MLRIALIPLRRAWWSWVASKWSGGGPRHRSYGYAVMAAYLAKCEWEAWIQPKGQS